MQAINLQSTASCMQAINSPRYSQQVQSPASESATPARRVHFSESASPSPHLRVSNSESAAPSQQLRVSSSKNPRKKLWGNWPLSQQLPVSSSESAAPSQQHAHGRAGGPIAGGCRVNRSSADAESMPSQTANAESNPPTHRHAPRPFVSVLG